MNRNSLAIEKGKQLGHSKSEISKGVVYWCDAAIQKYNDKYKVHVSIIQDDKMVMEKYDLYFTREFSCLNDAIICMEKYSSIVFTDLTRCKGQKIFNPMINEENETLLDGR